MMWNIWQDGENGHTVRPKIEHIVDLSGGSGDASESIIAFLRAD